MPKPNEGESRSDFNQRCMTDKEMVQKFPKKAGQKYPEQRYAVCQSYWREAHPGAGSDTSDQSDTKGEKDNA